MCGQKFLILNWLRIAKTTKVKRLTITQEIIHRRSDREGGEIFLSENSFREIQEKNGDTVKFIHKSKKNGLYP